MTRIPDSDALRFFLAQMATKATEKDRLELFLGALMERGQAAMRGPALTVADLFGIKVEGERPAPDAMAEWLRRAEALVAHEALVLTLPRGATQLEIDEAATGVLLLSANPAAIAAARRVMDASAIGAWM